MDKQIREMSKNRTWKRLLKRGVALLCVVVMLFTMNTLKRNADTLERIAMCGYAEHVHSEACYVGDALSCGMTEHIHTDACYQETPVSMGIDDIDVTMDAPAVDGISADLDLSLALDGLDLVTEDVAPEEPAANAGETGAFSLGTGALVSAIIEAVGLNVSLDGIVEVGAVENDEAHSGLLAIERVEGDYRVTARRDFDEARLALITADDVNVVRLQNGVAPVETMAVESPATGEQRAEGPSQPENGLLNEEMPEGDGQLALVDTAPVEAEQPDVEAIAVAEDDQAGDKTEIVAEEGAGEANPGTEEEALATDIAPEGDVTLPTGDEQVAEELGVVGAGDPVAQQQGEGVAEAGDEARPAEAAVGEQGGEEEAGALFAGDDGESDAPAEEMASQEEEPTVEDGGTALEEAQPAANDEEVSKEEQPAEDGGEGPALEDAAEAPAEAQNAGDGEEGQPAEDAGDREEVSEEEQPAGDGEAQLEGEEPGETSAEAQSDREPAEEAAEAQPEEEPAEEAAEAQPEEEPAEEAAEAQSEEDPAEESGEAQPEEEPAEEAAEAQPGEEPAEEAAEAQPGEQPAEEAEGEAPGEEADGDRSACTATIDMAQVSEYPMSLNALVAQIAPVSNEAAAPDDETVEDGEGTDEDTADETAAATSESSWTVEYDRELLEVTEDGQDCLITPVRSFESTLIVADNGGRYALTLVNCALEQAATEEAEVPEAEQPSRPAQEFEGSTEYVRVCVSAPEGAFPEGTTMALADVEDEKTLTDIEDTVTGGFVRVERVHAVDITFFDAEGNEIEPLVPISVVMAVAEIAREEEAVVVHVDGDGAPQVVESRSEAPEGETGLKVEMPAAEAPEADGESAEAQAPESTDVPAEAQADAEATAGTGEAAVGFEADSFSVYAVVVTRTLEAKYIDARGDTWSVSVGYAPEALIPDDARLAVSEVTDERYLAEAEAALEGGKRVTLARFFDISILDADGTEVQPAVPVTVNIALDNSQTRQAEAAEHVIDSGEPEVCAVHFEEEKTDIVTAAETEEAVVFDAQSFSVWGVMYTVDFYYGDYEYHMPGEGYITLSGLFGVLGIEADATQATDVVFTNPELVAVRKVEEDTQLSAIMVEFAELNVDAELEGEAPPEAEADETVIPAGTWLLISLAPFNTEEKLTVTMEDGTVYEIRVEDDVNDDGTLKYYFKVNAGGLRGYLSLSSDNGEKRVVAGTRSYRNNDNTHLIGFAFKNDYTAYVAPTPEEGSRFVCWLRDDGASPTVDKKSWSGAGDNVPANRNVNFVAYFAPVNDKLIVISPYDRSFGTVDTNTVNKVDNNDALPYYRYSGNDGVTGPIKAVPNSECFFKGWFTPDGECYSTSRELDVSAVEKDLVLTPQFGQNYKYSVIPNESGKAHFHYHAWGTNYDTDDAFKNLPTEGVPDSGICSFRFPVSTWAKDSNYEFVYWLRDDGTTPITDIGNDGKASTLRGFANQTDYNIIDRNTTYVAFYKPKGDYLIRTNWPAEGGYPKQESANHGIRTVHDDFSNNNIFWFYYANADHPVIGAIPNEGWVFEGWYHNGTELISTDASFDVYNYIYNNTEGKGRRDLNLTPVFKKTSGTFHVWFDGTNGIGGGDHSRNNTFYTRINGSGVASGTNSVLRNYDFANSSYTINSMPSAAELGITNPMSQGDTKFVVKGWYDVYNNKYYNVGDSATITADTVFYADWGPSDYDIGKNSSVAHNLNTGNFIRTKVFDYNNLFNMSSITLDRGRSVIPEQQGSSWNDYNKEYWSMSGDSDDFIFMSTVSATGRSLNPYGRTERNQNRETSTNGTYYTAIVTQGLLNSSLRDRLFSTSSDSKTNPGQTYVGSDSYLYNYDKTTGYYYYDSDKNAASYNANDHRFYVYSYTNQTNKSDSGDKTDFLPFNYGPYNFSETYGAPNYWFGMSSEIDFFLPNPTGYQDDNNVTGNRSNLGDEMIYKFAGDDDVWVYVDGKLVLDMGGVHGKIYGEINFSTGEWKVIGNGASKVDNSPTIDYTYSDSSCLLDSDTLNLSEGDHTLTLYYLERGASQSNCAIYFNLAPRYQLRFAKKDSLTKDGLQGARFGVYADAACTVAADLKHWNETTNEFTSGDDGIVHAQGLAAGRTYYIKELQAPANYPDMSGYVMALTLDSHGNPTITVPADAANMVDTSGLQPVSGKDRTYKLNMVNGQPDMIYLPILNNSETSITATKTWSLLDGKAYRTFEMDGKLITEYENSAASVKVQLQRYYEDNNSSEIVGNHTVQLVTQYFRSGSGTSNGDDASLAHYQTETRTVGDGGTVSFSLSTDTGAGIYSVVSTGGSLSANVTGTTEGKPFKVNGSSANRPNAGNYTVSNIRNDAVIYITVIGAANSEADLMGKVHLTGVQATNGDGTARRISRDTTGFNDDPKDKNGEDIPDNGEVTLSKANGWTHTWQNLATDDGQGHRVYYYVVEKDPVTPQSAALGGASAFIRTTSSDGLSGGIITVQNSLRAVKVKLRKKDEQRHNGNDVPLQGAEFYIYTEEEYAKRNGQGSGTALTPSADLISPSEMGSPNGTKLVTDSYGRFYTGFLPQGVYYIVEEKAPDGYEPLNRHVKVVISETGMAYGDVAINEAGIPTVDLGGVNMTSQKPDASGIYNLYIADTVKKGGIKLQKLWKSDSDYGLTKACEGNDFALDENGKLYSKSDNGATAVLLSLGAVVNDALDADAVNLILDNPGSYGLSGKVVTVDGKKYIRLGKTDGVWPALEITNLPMKRHVRVQVTENGKTKDVERAVDVWYFIEEVGCYYDNNGTEVLAKVADKTDQWMVSYGWVNGEGDGTGKTQTIGGKTYCLIKARESHPDTLTVTNGMKGDLSFSKQDGRGNPVEGAVFQIIPNNAGAGNYMTGIDAMLTSGADGMVNISGLPIGIYWMWEKEAPAGYQKTDAMYCLMIGYTESRMYLVAGNEWPVASVVDNTPLGALKLTKTVQVDGAAPTAANRAKTTGVYTFAISGLGGTVTQDIARTVSITFTDGRATSYQIDSDEAVPIPETEATDNSWTVTVPDLVPGIYTIQETPPQNGMTLKSVTAGEKEEGELAFVKVAAGDTAAEQVTALATFINNYGKADVKIVKIDENTRSEATQKRLSGAEFRLVKGDEDPQTHEVSYNAIYPNETEGVKQTGDTGELTFENLPDGHYRLQETGVPDGYVLTDDPYIYFTITEGALSWTDSSGAPITDGQEHNKVTCDMADKTYTVGNEPGVSLPNTGGHGTLPYTVGGTLLILCAIAIAVESRRRQKNTDWSN